MFMNSFTYKIALLASRCASEKIVTKHPVKTQFTCSTVLRIANEHKLLTQKSLIYLFSAAKGQLRQTMTGQNQNSWPWACNATP